jgi:hypothetical protein
VETTPPAITYVEDPGLTSDGVETVARCKHCGAPYVPTSAAHLYCTEQCRYAARSARPAQVAAQSRRSAKAYTQNASYRQARRTLLRAGVDPDTRPEIQQLRGAGVVADWRARIGLPRRPSGPRASTPATPRAVAPSTSAETSTDPTRLDPWRLASPSCEHTGHAVAVGYAPSAALDLTQTRRLHGSISFALASGHERNRAGWSLAPSDRGWVAVFYDRESAERVRAQSFESRLGAEPRQLIFGATVAHMKAPRPLPAGRYRVRVETVTPVSWDRNAHTEATTAPGHQTIVATVDRISRALRLDVPEAHRAVACIASETRAVRVFVGGHWIRGTRRPGVVMALEGRFTVECNAVVAWLLACAEVLGLGGACSLGFGRVRVSVERVEGTARASTRAR